MKTSEIQALIEEDSEIDENKLEWEVLRIPKIHNKFYRIFVEELQALKGASFEYHRMRKERIEFYLGKAPDEVYEAEPLDHKVLKTDLDVYLLADEKLVAFDIRLQQQKIKVEMLEAFLKTLNTRGYNIKTSLDVMKFKAGEH